MHLLSVVMSPAVVVVVVVKSDVFSMWWTLFENEVIPPTAVFSLGLRQPQQLKEKETL